MGEIQLSYCGTCSLNQSWCRHRSEEQDWNVTRVPVKSHNFHCHYPSYMYLVFRMSLRWRMTKWERTQCRLENFFLLALLYDTCENKEFCFVGLLHALYAPILTVVAPTRSKVSTLSCWWLQGLSSHVKGIASYKNITYMYALFVLCACSESTCRCIKSLHEVHLSTVLHSVMKLFKLRCVSHWKVVHKKEEQSEKADFGLSLCGVNRQGLFVPAVKYLKDLEQQKTPSNQIMMYSTLALFQ